VVNGDRQAALLGQSAPNWFELDRDPRATLVKSGHHRRTWRVSLNNVVIFAKVFDAQRGYPFSRIAYALGLGAAHREWRASRAAERRGVPAVRCLALGVDRRRRGAAVLLSEGLPNAIPLSQAWEQGASSRSTALSLIEAVARLFASAHNRGFVHRDAHPSNILIQPTADGGWEASYVDLHGAYLFKDTASIRHGRAVRSLAQLDHYFQRRASRLQRWRFLQNYVSLRRSFNMSGERRVWCENGFSHQLLSSIARARATHAAALARQRDRRIHRNGKYFATIALGNGWKGTFVLQLERRHAFPEPTVPDRSEHDWRNLIQAVFTTGARMDSRTSRQRNDDTFAVHGVYVERAGPIGMRAQMLWSLNGSPQRREFVRSHRLRHRDIANELILACLEHRSTVGLIDETFLVRAVSSSKS
jgi:tRNA A-37 threonylcarbamoyl transferase component Bud32